MTKEGTDYTASKEEIKILIKLESLFDFPTTACIFQILPHVDPEPLVTLHTYCCDYSDDGTVERPDAVLLQEFARKHFKRWWWSNWGFYVEYKTLKEFLV